MTQTESGETPEQAPVDPKQAARAEVEAYMEDPDRYRFDDGLDLSQQHAWQHRFVDWRADVLLVQRREYGDDYQLGEDMSPRYAEGLLNALFEALCGLFSSSLRSPPRNAAATAFAPKPSKDPNAPPERPLGELAFDIDAMVIGGGVGGTGSFIAEKILLPALAEVAARHNLPKMKAVNMAALCPTPPKGVPRLIVREGPDGRRVKRFYVPTGTEPAQGRSGLGKVPTEQEVRDEAERQQWWIDFVCKALEEDNLGALFGAPVVTGVANAARRRAMTEEALNAWDAVLGTSMLASGGAGAVSKFVLNAMKCTPYVSQTWVDDLVGGRQRLNKFVPVGRGGSGEMAKWRDMKTGLIPAAGEATVEAAKLLIELFRHNPTLLTMDWFFRHVLPNVAVSIAAPGYGGFLAQAARLGSFDPLPGENVHSWSNIVQQFGASFFNDLTWKVLQNLMAIFKADLVKYREARLTIEAERLRDDRADGVERVSGYSVEWSEGLRLRAEAARAPRTDDDDALQLPERIALDTREDIVRAAASVRAARDALAAGAAPEPRLTSILERMSTVIDYVVRIDEALAKKDEKKNK
ncbi:MAG TPA: hypothetical protein VF169_12735 [Albitalea sp.]